MVFLIKFDLILLKIDFEDHVTRIQNVMLGVWFLFWANLFVVIKENKSFINVKFYIKIYI